ncbi:hypothetical protein [Paenibacillus polymyxa]|uniref:Uncharacterized protein n=1 Tax=Paenibacillus polymyxa TaxID=1406 RepID=A0AAE9L6I5_PAEPO|nr:hypothetical protein [Paenibacillus polymyxa]URJ48387.1 hypothetical protein MF626_002621 [Paenibacillus polymyxa]
MSENEITYQEIIEFFQQHREIEFYYRDKLYAFLSYNGGFVLVCENKAITPTFETYEEMVEKGLIDGKKFLERFKNNELTIAAVL